MRNTLRLGGPAIRAMLERDPEFEFELQRCVVAEIIRTMFPKDLNEIIRKTIATEVEKARASIVSTGLEGRAYDQIVAEKVGDAIRMVRAHNFTKLPKAKTDEIGDAIQAAIDSTIRREINVRIETARNDLDDQIDKALERFDLPGMIEKTLQGSVEAEIDRRVTERLGRIAEAAKAVS